MAVKIFESGSQLLFPLTSPPPSPVPFPSKEVISKIVTYDDRDIVVTIPLPGTIELVAGVTNEIQIAPDVSGKSIKKIYNELDEDIRKSLVEVAGSLPAGITGQVNPHNPTKARFFIEYDDDQPLSKAVLTLTRKKGADFYSWQIRLEFSPLKAALDGLVKLTSRLNIVLPFLNLAALVEAFKISRVDAAVDCIGAMPLDLIGHVPKAGKQMVFVGDNGHPESVYFFAKKHHRKQPPKILSVSTRGPLRLTLYERRDYHVQLALEPPYGPCPVTRAEVSKRWKKKRPPLAELAQIENLFIGRRVAYAAAVPAGNRKLWRQFCLAVFGGGIDKSLFSWFPGPGMKFAAAYRECDGDLVDPSCWSRWQDGIAYTGLDKWMQIAQTEQ